MCVYLVASVSNNGNLIGDDTTLLWDNPLALSWFKMHIANGTLIMGHRAWKCLSQKTLPNCTNIVVSRGYAPDEDNVCYCTTLTEAVHMAGPGPVCIVGGGRLFHSALLLKLADACILTHFDVQTPASFNSNALPVDRNVAWESKKLAGLPFHFEISVLSKK